MQKEITTTTTRSELSKLQSFNSKDANALKKELNKVKNQFEELLNSSNNNCCY